MRYAALKKHCYYLNIDKQTTTKFLLVGDNTDPLLPKPKSYRDTCSLIKLGHYSNVCLFLSAAIFYMLTEHPEK